jgi:hypothetical protein
MKYWSIDPRFYQGTPAVPIEDPAPPMLPLDPIPATTASPTGAIK